MKSNIKMTNNIDKTSYKNIILLEQVNETKETKENTDNIEGYDNIINFLKEMKTQTYNKKLTNSKKELMIDVLNYMSNVTEFVNDYYGFHGIGNDLKLEDVIDSLDKSVNVEIVSENDYDIESEEEM